MSGARLLVVARAEIAERRDLDAVSGLSMLPVRPVSSEPARALFDAVTYDRLRVLLTELQRVREDGGAIAVRRGTHTLPVDRLAVLLRAV
jgi:hypothetical protein